MVKLVCESLDDFKRGVDPRTGLDIGADSSYFWPKEYDELSDEQKKEVYEKWLNTYSDNQWIVDDDYLLEPPDAEMRAMFPDYDEWAPLIINNNHQEIYYDSDIKGTLDIKGAVKIEDDDHFHEWLGIPSSFRDNVHSTIDKYTIEFEENDYDIDFTEEQNEILEVAQKKWEDHLNNIHESIKNSYEHSRSEEFFKEEAESAEWEFNKNLEVV